MTRAWISGIGVLGPGLDGWEATCATLRQEQPYAPQSVAIPEPAMLPPRDRRRCSKTVALALHVAQQTLQAAGLEAATTPSVFANSAGDGQIVHRLLSALAKPDKPVSPTDFHNSVHNAPAFYWTLGAGCHGASTSIAAGRFTFAAALLKAAVQGSRDSTAVLMVCFDNPMPPPLDATYPIFASCAVGLALRPRPAAGALAAIDLSWRPVADAEAAAQPPDFGKLSDLWSGNPAGRALPLLEAIARGQAATLALPSAIDAVLDVRVTCP